MSSRCRPGLVDRDDELPSYLSRFEITQGLRDLLQGISPVDYRFDLAAFEQIAHGGQVLGSERVRKQSGELLFAGRGQNGLCYRAGKGLDPLPHANFAGLDVDASGREDSPVRGERMPPTAVDDEIVAACAASE